MEMSIDAMTMFLIKLIRQGYTVAQANKKLMEELNVSE
jgi:hypothetical protein